jgi:hypothetical protein
VKTRSLALDISRVDRGLTAFVLTLMSNVEGLVVYTGRLFSDSMWDSLGMNPFSPGLPTLNIPERQRLLEATESREDKVSRPGYLQS